MGLLDRYAASFDAPVAEATTVEEVALVAPASDHPHLAVTDRGTWRARHVVVATGPNGVPRWPAAVATEGAGGVEVIAASRYRNPAQLASGGVLVVGASASGVQIADELARAGREVVLAVGRHTRMPRRYRGMDIFWWLQSTGRLARTIDDMPDVAAARREPSLQLVGRNAPELIEQNVDLAALQAIGVRLAGRLERLTGARARFRDDLADTVAAADRRMHRFLDVADAHAERPRLGREGDPPVRPAAVDVPAGPARMNLRAEGISTVLLATGYRPHHPWLRVPVTAPDGSIEQYHGRTAAPGLYVVGQRFQHRRDSGFIDGVRHDAAAVVRHLLHRHVDTTLPPVSSPASPDHLEDAA